MSHRLGQVFLHDANILTKLMTCVTRQDTQHCVEVGCGDGILSEALARVSTRLSIIEADKDCLDATRLRLGTTQAHIQYYHADIRQFPGANLQPQPYQWVSNLPYYISAKFMQKLVAERDLWQTATLMLQREFAQKLVALPGDKLYSSLGLYCQYYLAIQYEFAVSKTCFYPVPAVESAVITCRPNTDLIPVNTDVLFRIIRSAFWGRRKPLLSALKKSPYFTWLPDYEATLTPLLGRHRGETLSLENFCEITACISD